MSEKSISINDLYMQMLNQQSNMKTINTAGVFFDGFSQINKTDMSLSTIAKRLLDADTRTLIKAGFLDNQLNLTGEGKVAMWAILFEANKAALVTAATELLAEQKADK